MKEIALFIVIVIVAVPIGFFWGRYCGKRGVHPVLAVITAGSLGYVVSYFVHLAVLTLPR